MKNWKQKLAVAATTAMTDGTADLYTIGGVVVGFVVVGVVFGAGLKLFRKGG